MARIWKNKQFWGALIGIVLLAYCVKDIRPAEIKLLLQRVNFLYLVLAALTGFIFIALKGLRWRLIVARQKKVPYVRAVTLYAVGQFLGIVMPALTGQVGRVVLFSRKEGFRKTFIFSTLLLEILFDAISLIVFMFVTSLAFAFPENYRYLSFMVAGGAVTALIILYLILHFQLRIEEFGRKRLRERWPGFYVVSRKFLRSFAKGMDLLRSSQHVAGTTAISLALWTAHMLVVWFLIMAFGLKVEFAAAPVVMIINTIVLMVPVTPGNAGTFEFAVSTSLAAFHVGRSDAVLFALALHLVDLLPVFAFSYLFLHLDKSSLREIKAAEEKDSILARIDEDGSYIEEEKV